MSNQWCDVACFVSGAASMAVDTLSTGAHIIHVIFGGLVAWCLVLIVRWIIKRSSPRRRGR